MSDIRRSPMRAALLACALAPFSAAPGRAQAPAGRWTPLFDSAQAALREGRIEPAIHFAEQYASRNYRDPQAWITLGDAYFRRMPAGRFQALRAYEEATRRAPADPEPHYRYAQVGIYLGGDDGEGIARRGLERVMELDPLYRQAWTQWLLLFRNTASRRRMRDRLERFDSIPDVRARMAWLDIEDELYPIADSLLDRLLEADSTNPAWLAWRAQSAFEAGDAERGAAFYTRALAHAERDTLGALWAQAVGLARPDELRAWERVPPDDRGAWLTAFWARRNPDLFAGANARVAEHFQRLRYARRNYPLLHPLVTYHRSQLSRSLNLEPATGERVFYSQCEMYETRRPPTTPVGAVPEMAAASGGVSRAADRARIGSVADDFNPVITDDGTQPFSRTIFVPLNMDLRGVDTSAARIGYNLSTGLEDRGLLYLRFGRPENIEIGGRDLSYPGCANADVERWRYEDIGEIRFARPSAFSRGERTVSEMVFRSMNERQFEAMKTALTRDASSQPAPLEFGVWTAQFAGGQAGTTEIAVLATRGQVAATLGDAGESRDVRRSTNGVVLLQARPGRHMLIVQARDSGVLGRQELGVEVRAFASPSISDLVLAPAWPATSATRWDMLRRARRTLVFAEGEAMRVYAEIYGLVADGGAVRYTASYLLLRSDHPERDRARDEWPGAVQLRFDRETPVPENNGAARDIVDITPERLPAGKYLLRLVVYDRVADRPAGRSQISFEVR